MRRRRECLSCGERFTTFETAELVMPHLIKRDGRREPFDEKKLRYGLSKALEKRPVSVDQIETSVNHIKSKLRSTGERELPALQVGRQWLNRRLWIPWSTCALHRFTVTFRTSASSRKRSTNWRVTKPPPAIRLETCHVCVRPPLCKSCFRTGVAWSQQLCAQSAGRVLNCSRRPGTGPRIPQGSWRSPCRGKRHCRRRRRRGRCYRLRLPRTLRLRRADTRLRSDSDRLRCSKGGGGGRRSASSGRRKRCRHVASGWYRGSDAGAPEAQQ